MDMITVWEITKVSTIIGALDMSLSGTGITILGSDGKVLHQEKLESIKMNTKSHKNQTRLRIIGLDNTVNSEGYIETSTLLDMTRIAFFKDRIMFLFQKYGVNQAIIEGYAFASKGRSVISLGELGGVIRFAMYEAKIPYVQAPPFSVKAFMTGLTWAKKEEMIAAILDQHGVWIEDDNIADSFAMAHMLYTFKDRISEYCSEGGVDKIRDIKVLEFREKYKKDKVLLFQKTLGLGRATSQDYTDMLEAMGNKSMKEISEILLIKENDLLAMSKKLNMKKLNEAYKLKKPKASKPDPKMK
jgi:Holliday junction resolvasome RuvABC endonuclease subunit